MSNKQYTSNALWPEGTVHGPLDAENKNTTMDNHFSRSAAAAVCRLLEKGIFGGEGKVFPIKTWVEGPTED